MKTRNDVIEEITVLVNEFEEKHCKVFSNDDLKSDIVALMNGTLTEAMNEAFHKSWKYRTNKATRNSEIKAFVGKLAELCEEANSVS